MSTVVTYNGIRLHHCSTKRFDQQTVYDDTGTDYLYTKFHVQVVGYVHANLHVSSTANTGVRTDATSFPPGSTAYANMDKGNDDFTSGAAQNFNVIRTLLAQPRADFEMRVGANEQGTGGDILLSASAITLANAKSISGRDVDNGPKPKGVSITRLTGNAIYRVEFEIEVCRVECSVDGSASTNNNRGVLSNRWAMTDEIDNNFYCTRTITGRLRVASANLNPHSFRQLVMPPLNKYFRRERIQFTATADNLNLDYTIVDKEIAFAAPIPASSWHVSFQESSASARISQTTISIRLTSARNVNKQVLFQIAAQIIDARGIRLAGGNAGGVVIFREATFTDVYGDAENYIEAHAVLEHAGGEELKDAPDILSAVGTRLGKPLTNVDIPGAAGNIPPYNYEQSINPVQLNAQGQQAGPTGLAGLFACHLQTACELEHNFYITSKDLPAKNEPASGSGQDAVVTVNTLPGGVPLPDTVSTTEHHDYPYTYYRMQTTYEDRASNVQVPLATEKPGSSASGSTGQTSSSNAGSANAPTSTVVRLGGSVARLTARVAAERIGQWPELPASPITMGTAGLSASATTAAANAIAYKILDSVIIPEAVELTADGKKLYRSSMQITYAMSRALKFAYEGIRVGRQPWIKPSAVPDADTKTSPKMFKSSILPLP